MLADKSLYPPAYRLFSIHQLRAAGLATTEVARRLGISERHVRRLARREPAKVFEEVLAKRFLASLEQRASIEARRLVGLICTRLEREGIRSHVAKRYSRGGWMAKHPFRVSPDDIQVARAWLRDAGLSESEIRAVMRTGLSAEELNELFLRGIQAASESSAASRGIAIHRGRSGHV